jgi:hypothetical protein
VRRPTRTDRAGPDDRHAVYLLQSHVVSLPFVCDI